MSAKNFQANVFQPEKKRRNRDGYDDGHYTLFKKAGAAEFVRCPDPIAFLGSVNKITFDTEEEKEWVVAPSFMGAVQETLMARVGG